MVSGKTREASLEVLIAEVGATRFAVRSVSVAAGRAQLALPRFESSSQFR